MKLTQKIWIIAVFTLTLVFNFGVIYTTHAQDVLVTPDKGKQGSDISLNPLKETTRIGSYETLARLPGLPAVIDPGLEKGDAGAFTLPEYIKVLVRIAIGVIGILAVVMIVISGVQYMGSAMVTEKEGAKQRLTGAVLGLILAVSSVLLLRTINPQLTSLSIGDGKFQGGVDGVAEVFELAEELDIVDTSPAGNASQAGLSAPGLVSAPITEGPDKNGYFRMPDAPNGEYTFWPNTPEKERYGSRALIDTIYTVAMEWAKKHPEEKLVIGDMNVPPPNRHLSHRTGIDVDIYTKASTGDANKSGSFVSNEDKAVQLGKMFADTKNVFAVYYNVIKVQQEVNPYANNVAGHAPYQRPTAMMFTQAHHFNHFHVRIPTKFKGPDVAR